MLFLLIDFLQKLKFRKTHDILITLFYVGLFLSQKQRICSPHKKSKKIIPQQVIGGNKINLDWKIILRYFPQITPHKRKSESPD